MALDQFRSTLIRLDKANQYAIENQFVKQGDANGRSLLVQVTNAGLVEEQNNIALNLKWRNLSTGSTGYDNFVVEDASQGLFKFIYPTEMTSSSGYVVCDIEIIENETIVNTRSFRVQVESAAVDGELISSSNEFSALQTALVRVTNLEENYAPELQGLTEQLAETDEQLNLSKPYLTNFFKAVERALAGGPPAVVAFLGDSVTAANEPNAFYSHPEYLQEWFNTKYGAGKVTVVNAGNGGQDARMMNTRIARDVINDNPDAIIVSSGWNDIGLNHMDTYESYMNRIVDTIKKTTKKPVDIVLRTTNVGTNSNMSLLRSTITPAIYRVAKRHNVQIFDLLSIMDRDIESGNLVLADFLADGDDKHPNSFGQEYIFDEIKPIFDNTVSLTKQSEAPQFVSEFDYIQANDTRITNSGFAVAAEDITNSYHPYGVALVASSYAVRSASMKFFGRRIGLSLLVGEFTGILDVTIDGVSFGSIDTYEFQDNVTFNRNLRNFYFEGLTDGEHTIVLSHSSVKNAASSGTSIYINGFIVEKKFSSYYKVAPKLTGTKLYYNAADKATRVDVISNTTAFVLPFDRIQTNNGSTAAVTDNAITVAEAGFYHALGSFKVLTGNIDGRLYIRVNGGNRSTVTIGHTGANASDKINQINAHLWLNAGDKVTLVFQRLSADNVSLKYDNNFDTALQLVKTI